MQLGLRAILLALAILLFVIGVFSSGETALDLLLWGLASTAAAFLVEELGWTMRWTVGGPGTRTPTGP